MTASAEFSDGEPKVEDYPFAGWVPTVNGRLSFRHIGEASYPLTSVYANAVSDQKRFIVGYQYRQLSDVLFKWATHSLQNLSGSFLFAISATSAGPPKDDKFIFGSVYVFKTVTDFRSRAKKVVDSDIRQIHHLRLDAGPQRDANIAFHAGAANTKLSKTADICLKFVLARTGEVYFALPEFSDEELRRNSVEYAAINGHDFEKWLADQAYFFLRDISHRHQHHHPTSDTILILQDRRLNSPIEWRTLVIYSLEFFAIRLKRAHDVASVSQAMGILAYCRSFRQNCERFIQEHKPHPADLPEFNDDALLLSLQARAKTEEAFAFSGADSAARNGVTKLFILGAGTVIMAVLVMFATLSERREKLSWFKYVADFAAFNFFQLVGLLMYASIFWYVFTRERSAINILIPGFDRDFLELANARKLAFIIWGAIIVALLTMLIGSFAYPAILDLYQTLAVVF